MKMISRAYLRSLLPYPEMYKNYLKLLNYIWESKTQQSNNIVNYIEIASQFNLTCLESTNNLEIRFAMFPAWIEAVVPLVLITGLIGAAGGLQAGVHHLFYGKPKLICADDFDRLVEKRDQRVMEDWQKSASK